MTYTGTQVTREFGSPNIRDMAVQGMRIVRFVGAGKVWWPIGMHSMLVADLVPDRLQAHALVHDLAGEVVISDIPSPVKADDQRFVEERVYDRTIAALGLWQLGPEDQAVIDAADERALFAEIHLGCGPRGLAHAMSAFRRDHDAEAALATYLRQWNPMDAIDTNGRWARTIERRIIAAVRDARRG